MSIVKDLALITLAAPLILFLNFNSNLWTGLILIGFVMFLFYKCHFLNKKLVMQRDYFIKTLSHDLRVSTLAQIRALELLKKTTPEASGELVLNLSDSCRYTLDMINMLLNTYRYENGESVLNYEKVNIQELCSDCYNDLSPIMQDKDINVSFNINSYDNIEADKYGITKLLNTLISIAIVNSDKANKIYVEISKPKNMFEVSVNYRGKSLTPEECRRMFSDSPRFSTVGHGIRMLLCKKIVEFHGGNIYVKSDGKKNNSFIFKLPVINISKNPKNKGAVSLQLNNL